MKEIKNLIWEEKYRPNTLDDLIIPERLKNYYKEIIKSKEIPNMLLVGFTGLGKTTLAKIIVNTLGAEYLFVNGSKERGIDILRDNVEAFVNTVSIVQNCPKFVIIDDAGNMTHALIEALKGFIEQSSNNARFIFTSNHDKFPDAILSRLSIERFNYTKEERIYVKTEFFKRIKDILDKEGIEYSERVLANFIKKEYPGFRKIIVSLQKHAKLNGKIDESILCIGESINDYYRYLKEKNYRKCIDWIKDNDIDGFYEKIFDDLEKVFMKESIPGAIEIIAEYMYRSKYLQSNERKINLSALTMRLFKAKYR